MFDALRFSQYSFIFFNVSCFLSQNVIAQEHLRYFFFRNNAVASFEFNDSEPKKFSLKYSQGIITDLSTIYEGVGLDQLLVVDNVPGLEMEYEDIEVRTAPRFTLDFTWFHTSNGLHYLFQDGTIAKSCSSAPRVESTAKLIHQNGKRFFIESFLSKSGEKQTILSYNLEGTQCQILENEYHRNLSNPYLHYLTKADGSALLIKIQPKCTIHILSEGSENYTISSCNLDIDRPEGTYITRFRDGKTLQISHSPLKYPENISLCLKVEDGILSIPKISKKVDLLRFDEEVSMFGNLRPMDKLTEPDGKPINIEQEVRAKYLDLVKDSREHPVRYFQESRPEILTRVSEALRANRSAVLLGEAGTGKTSAVKAFARDIGQGRIKGFPRTTEIFEISSSSLASSTMYVGTIETRISELKAMAKGMGAIFFFDELHSLAGTGTHSHQSNDVTQQLKGPIEAGEMRILATDTPLEFIDAYSWDLPFVQRFEKISTLAPIEKDQVKMIQEHFTAKGYPRLSTETTQLVIELTKRFEPTSEQPRPTVNLLTMALQRMITLDRATEEPTLEVVHSVAKERYGIDPALFNRTTLLEKLTHLKSNLSEIVIGQDRAKQAIHHVWATHLRGGTPLVRRVNSLLFVGSGGVGKTWMIESSAKAMGYQTTRISMTKYSSRSRLGIDAFQEEVYKAVEKNPFTVIVLEGIEEADESVQQIIIPMLSEGRFRVMIEHGAGKKTPREVSVKDALFLMTTRATSDLLGLERMSAKDLREALASEKITDALLSQILYVIPMSRPTREEFEEGIRLYLSKTLKEQGSLYHATFKLEKEATFISELLSNYGPTSDYRDIHEAMRNIEIAAQEASLSEDFVPDSEVSLKIEPHKKKSARDSLADLPAGVQMMYL